MNHSDRQKTIWLIVIFSILVNVAAWIAPLLGGSPSSPGLGFIVWGTAPLVISLLMRAVTHDWTDLGIKPEIRKNIRWYILSLLAYPAIMVLTLISGTLVGAAAVSEFSPGQYFQIVLTALPIFFIFAILEEVGWRGYLAPKLDSLGVNRYIASAVIGIVWASWHMPYIRELTWGYTSESLLTLIPRFYLVSFAFSIVYGEIRTVTATFWPAVLLHATSNSFGHPLAAEYLTIAPGNEYLGSLGNGLFIIVFFGLLGIVLNRWRMRKADLASLSKSFA